MGKHYYIKIQCQNCPKILNKRIDGLKHWSGLCMSCAASKHLKGNSFTKGHKLSDEHKKKLSIAGKGRKYTIEERINRSKSARKGSNCNLWKGGICPINKLIRTSLEYKLWRTAVFERDNYTCIWCGIRSAKGIKVELHADHIKPFSLFPAIRFAIDNGRTLCVDCHRKTDTYGNNINKLKQK